MIGDLQNIGSLSETSLNNIRQISHQLMPPQLETFGLVKTLEFVSEQLNKTDDIKLELKAPEIIPDMSFPLKLAFYRIFMELINNTIKHSGANKITVELNFNLLNVIGLYRDNGKGIVAESFQEGMGQKSMEGRVNSLGGTMTSGNHPEGGFYASICIPLGA